MRLHVRESEEGIPTKHIINLINESIFLNITVSVNISA